MGAAYGSSIPPLTALPLRRDACRITDLDPDAARARQIDAVHSLGNDALSTEPARIGEDGRPVLGYVFVEYGASFGVAQQLRQRSLAAQEREIAQTLAIMLDQVEGI